jgi:cardiolipin synthase A/B
MSVFLLARLWLLCALLALPGFFRSGAVEKIIRYEIQTSDTVHDPAFQESISHQIHAPLVAGNKIKELVNGVEFFPAMIEAIRHASNTITFENFIWRSGVISDQFIEALTERALAGVKVHCIVDSFGAFKFDHSDQKRLRAAGVELEIFNPIRFWNCWEWNHRTHRKTLVIDGKIGFIGGICIADEWMGNATQTKNWRDTEYRVEGPVVGQLQGIFMDNWTRCTSRVLHGTNYFPAPEEHGRSMAQAFKSGPQDGAEHARLVYLYSIAVAKKSIRLSHSYFVPDNLAIDELVKAAERGVKIEIITPGIIDWNIVRRAARSRWDRLMAAGVQFYEFQPARYHCKSMIVDDAWVTCGSINFDDRSFRINGEGNINIYDPEFAARQIRIFEQDKAQSVRIDPKRFKKRPLRVRLVENFWGFFRGLL